MRSSERDQVSRLLAAVGDKGDPDVQVMAKKFVFTSTTEPELWYDDPEGEWARRIREFGVKIYYPLAAAAR